MLWVGIALIFNTGVKKISPLLRPEVFQYFLNIYITSPLNSTCSKCTAFSLSIISISNIYFPSRNLYFRKLKVTCYSFTQPLQNCDSIRDVCVCEIEGCDPAKWDPAIPRDPALIPRMRDPALVTVGFEGFTYKNQKIWKLKKWGV